VQSRADDAAPYAKTYDKGWDRLREERLARMKKAGSVPKNTPLTTRSAIPQPDAAKRLGSMTADGANPAWDSLDEERRADLARRMAAFAGMVGGMDRNIGRLVTDLKRSCASPKLDSPIFSTASLVILPTTIFQIKIRT
jgi:arylsulfatase A-like enzyme